MFRLVALLLAAAIRLLHHFTAYGTEDGSTRAYATSLSIGRFAHASADLQAVSPSREAQKSPRAYLSVLVTCL